MLLLEVTGRGGGWGEEKDELLGYIYELETTEESMYRVYNVLSPDIRTYDFTAASLLMGAVM